MMTSLKTTLQMRWRSVRCFLQQGIPAGFYKNLSWQYLSNVWVMGLGFVYSLVLARKLGAAQFGLIASGLGFAGLVFGVVELRLHEAIIRYIAEFWEQGDHPRVLATVKLSLLADACTGCLALAILVLSAPLARTYLIRDPRGLLVIELCGLSVFFSNVASATATGLLRVFDQFKAYALVKMGGVTLNLLIVLIVVFGLGWGVIGVLVTAVFSSLVMNAVLVGVALLQLNQRIRWQTSAPITLLHSRLGEISRFVLSTYGLSLTAIPGRDLDVTLLTWFTSFEVVGVYKIAKNFMAALWQISDPFLFVVYPELARLWSRGDSAALKAFVKRLVVGLGGVSLLIFGVGFMVVPAAIVCTVGSGFSEAGIIFRWMAWSLLFWMPLLWINPLLMAAGRPNLSLRAAVLGSLLNLVLYVICIPLWSGRGAAFAYGAGVALTLTIAFWLGLRSGVVFPASVATKSVLLETQKE